MDRCAHVFSHTHTKWRRMQSFGSQGVRPLSSSRARLRLYCRESYVWCCLLQRDRHLDSGSCSQIPSRMHTWIRTKILNKCIPRIRLLKSELTSILSEYTISFEIDLHFDNVVDKHNVRERVQIANDRVVPSLCIPGGKKHQPRHANGKEGTLYQKRIHQIAFYVAHNQSDG